MGVAWDCYWTGAWRRSKVVGIQTVAISLGCCQTIVRPWGFLGVSIFFLSDVFCGKKCITYSKAKKGWGSLWCCWRGQNSLTLPLWLRGSIVRLSAPMSTIMPNWNPSVGWGAHTGFPSSIAKHSDAPALQTTASKEGSSFYSWIHWRGQVCSTPGAS